MGKIIKIFKKILGFLSLKKQKKKKDKESTDDIYPLW